MDPSSAFTTTSTGFSPTLSGMAALACPLSTADPFTATVASAWFTVGVSVTRSTPCATATA